MTGLDAKRLGSQTRDLKERWGEQFVKNGAIAKSRANQRSQLVSDRAGPSEAEPNADASSSVARLKGAPQKFAMSIDLEDYFQVWAFSDVIDRKSWDGFALRVEGTTHRILDMLDRTGSQATFFSLGWVAERAPHLIREIVERGHEIASHGYDHEKVFDQLPDEFRADIRKTKAILEDTGGVPVIGYRAAGFSMDKRTPWAHEILAEEGYLYSSSSHPIAHDHYGDPDAPQTPYLAQDNVGLVEAPVATTTLMGKRVSCAGGGWFRAAPYAWSKHLIDKAARNLDGPVIFYFHPWEIDAGQPRIGKASIKSRLRHYLNLGAMEGKLERLMSAYDWMRVDAVLSTTLNGVRENRSEAGATSEQLRHTNYSGEMRA